VGIVDFHLSENMWVAKYQLVVERIGYVGDIKLILFVGNLGIEQNVEQHIAEFLFDIGGVIAGESLSELIDFFDCVRAQALVGLFGIPRTAHTQNVECINHPAECGKTFVASI
jgi:hypothetical protein